MSKRVYKKISNIPDIGYGLFAGEDIKKGALITEFIGKKTILSKVTDNWSTLSFYDDKCIQCDKSNLASYANDCIILPKNKRNLLKIMKSEEQLYNSYDNLPPNAEIYQNDTLLRAWLKASRNIKKDEEIFVHYGLPFWIKTEAALRESESELDEYDGKFVVPSEILKSESFKKYVNAFYPDITKITIKNTDGVDIALLETVDKGGLLFSMDMLIGDYCEKIML